MVHKTGRTSPPAVRVLAGKKAKIKQTTKLAREVLLKKKKRI